MDKEISKQDLEGEKSINDALPESQMEEQKDEAQQQHIGSFSTGFMHWHQPTNQLTELLSGYALTALNVSRDGDGPWSFRGLDLRVLTV